MALLAGADGEGLSKRLGSLSIGALRQDGIEPVAIASLLARIGTADPVVPQRQLAAVIDSFDLGKFGRATAKFDPSELAKLNSQIVQELDFADVETRLADSGVTGDAQFWLAVRGNLATVDEARVWWDICTQPLTPIIDSPTVTNAAAALLPAGDLNSAIWSSWTKSIDAETGGEGKRLVYAASSGFDRPGCWPRNRTLLAIMGRERVIRRLQGDTA